MAAVLALTVAAACAAAAQPALPDTPEAFGAALKNWAARHKVAQALVVVRRDGRIVHRSSIGGIDRFKGSRASRTRSRVARVKPVPT